MIQSDDAMVPNMRVLKFQIDPKSMSSLHAHEVYSDIDEIEEES